MKWYKAQAAIILCAAATVFLLIYFYKSSFYSFHGKAKLEKNVEDTLIASAATALQSLDVPVGCVILYNDTIFSTGYNTVIKNSSAGGHAEINAISNAIQKIGLDAFSELDRKKLVLVTTFEPCMMCKGAIIEYNIQHVLFMKDKGLFHWLKNDAKEFRYELSKNQVEGAEKQDSLFRMHPQYKY
jgi:tRNA(Arg) A34 adenosine deaminase TadA